jgi:hypothetical protein
LDLTGKAEVQSVAPVGFALAFLSAKPLNFDGGEAKDGDVGKGFLDRFQSSGLDDCCQLSAVSYQHNMNIDFSGGTGLVIR